jgi:hypothetical protein
MATEIEPRQIELAPGDGAIVICEDVRPELTMPEMGENEHFSEHHVVLAAFALGYGLQDQRLLDLLGQIMEEKHQESAARKARE